MKSGLTATFDEKDELWMAEALLLHEAIGDQLTCIFVDTGLLRFQEGEQAKNCIRSDDHVKWLAQDTIYSRPCLCQRHQCRS
jgi:GMP synthase PP-ATPase subunit